MFLHGQWAHLPALGLTGSKLSLQGKSWQSIIHATTTYFCVLHFVHCTMNNGLHHSCSLLWLLCPSAKMFCIEPCPISWWGVCFLCFYVGFAFQEYNTNPENVPHIFSLFSKVLRIQSGYVRIQFFLCSYSLLHQFTFQNCILRTFPSHINFSAQQEAWRSCGKSKQFPESPNTNTQISISLTYC